MYHCMLICWRVLEWLHFTNGSSALCLGANVEGVSSADKNKHTYAALLNGYCQHKLAGAKSYVVIGGATPFYMAADHGNMDILNCLLKAGAHPNITNEDGLTPVQVGAAQGNHDAVKILLPLTSRTQDSPDCTVDGLIKHMQFEQDKQIAYLSLKNQHQN